MRPSLITPPTFSFPLAVLFYLILFYLILFSLPFFIFLVFISALYLNFKGRSIRGAVDFREGSARHWYYRTVLKWNISTRAYT